MATFEDVWSTTDTGGGSDNDSGFPDKVEPPAGDYIADVVESKLFTSKKGERILVVEYRTTEGDYWWADVRILTDGGMPVEGRIKAAKVLLDNLGVNTRDVTALPENVARVKGSRVTLEVVDTDYTRKDGSRVINTNVVSCEKPKPVVPVPSDNPSWT